MRLAALALLYLAPSAGAAGDSLNAPPAAAVNPVARQSLADFPATRERPLFAPSRRKAAAPPPPVQEPPQPPSPPPAVTLIGVIADQQGSQAMLESAAKTLRVRVGDEIMGWRVSDIGAQRLTLTLGDRAFSIALFSQKPANPPQLLSQKPADSPPVDDEGGRDHRRPPLARRDR